MSEAPDVFDFAGGEVEDLGEVEVGGERFDAGFGDFVARRTTGGGRL